MLNVNLNPEFFGRRLDIFRDGFGIGICRVDQQSKNRRRRHDAVQKLVVQTSMRIAQSEPLYNAMVALKSGPDWSKLDAKVLGHFAEKDDFFTPEKAQALEEELKSLGKDVQFFVYKDVDHAFFNDTRPEVYHGETSQVAWDRTLAHFRSVLQ